MNGRIKRLRESKGLTQKQLSEILGIPFRTMQHYEKDGHPVPSEIPRKLYEKFRVNLVWLHTGEGSMYHPVEQSTLSKEEIELVDLARQSPETMPLLKKALEGSRAMAEALESLKGKILKEGVQ